MFTIKKINIRKIISHISKSKTNSRIQLHADIQNCLYNNVNELRVSLCEYCDFLFYLNSFVELIFLLKFYFLYYDVLIGP